ncbi:MAG: hypothetical protein ACXQTJ_01160 [Candidatus Syntropharchaeales archaeon]
MILALRNRKLKELLKLEDNMEIAAVIPFGHPASLQVRKDVAGVSTKLHIN